MKACTLDLNNPRPDPSWPTSAGDCKPAGTKVLISAVPHIPTTIPGGAGVPQL